MRDSIKRKNEILTFVMGYSKEKGYPPTVREIGAAVGIKSSATVHRYLVLLKEDNILVSDGSKARTLRPVK